MIGDFIGPALYNLKKLVDLPIGSGEQNIVQYAPRIFVLNYLKASGQRITAAATKANIQAIKSGQWTALR